MRLDPIHRESLGLRIMFAALLAIAVVVGLTVRYQLSEETDQVRAKAVNLARLVTRLPARAEGEASEQGWQQVLMHQLGDHAFAYGTITNSKGEPAVEVTASGVIVPPAGSLASSVWVQDAARLVNEREVVEYFGPLRVGTDTGHFRIGFYLPVFAITTERLPFIASLMLPVFLLAPLFLFFVKREVGPLKEMNAELSEMLHNPDKESVGVSGGGELRGFVEQFNSFIDHAKDRIEEYQDEKSKLVTSEKFLSYRLNRFEAILNSVAEGMLVVDADGCVSFANQRVKSLLDLDPEKLIGSRLSECLVNPSLVEHFSKHPSNIAALVGESLVFEPEHRADLKLAATVHPLLETDEAATNHLVIFRDVSEEMRAQNSRSEFVAHLAHELKAPLHTLAMYSEALQDEAGTSEEFQLEATNVISDEVERLARLINNLLSMTQIEMGTLQMERQRIKLVDLVRDTVEAMERSARGRELTFELDLPNEVMPVQVDKDLLRIAINNLLTNAIKYTDPGGTVSISVGETNDAVTICVADTGIGIPADEQAQIFHKFYRAVGEETQSRSGHGLGLPLARDIVHMHHGSIRVESEPGEGSRFYIDLWKRTGIVQQAI